MGDKPKPPPSTQPKPLPPTHQPKNAPAKPGARLEGLASRDPTLALPKAAPPKFTPNIVKRVPKKEPKGDDIDSQLKGNMVTVLDPAGAQRNQRFFRPLKPSAKPMAKGPMGQGLGGVAVKKIEKDEPGDSMDVADSSSSSFPLKKNELEIDSSNPNHPSVLPFVDPQKQKELNFMKATKDKQADVIMAEIKHEIAMLEKEEEKAVPDVLVSSLDVPTPLMIEGEFLNEDNLFFIQLPSALPFTPTQANTNNNNNNNNNNNTTSDSNTDPNVASSSTLPPPRPKNPNEYVNSMRGVTGHLGKIVVYKSGKVKLRIGDILYDITAANNPNFLEELMVLDGSACYRVGPMSQHLIVTPDIEDLLQKTD